MQQWMRWQGLVALLAGVYAALSPIWTETETTATWTMVVLGVVTAAVAVWSLALAEEQMTAYALLLLGALFIGAPWALDVASTDNDTGVTAWIIGAVVAIAGVLTLPAVEERMHHRPIPH